MARRLLLRAAPALPFALGLAAYAAAGRGRVGSSIGLDYENDAAAAIAALARGDFATSLSHQPLMGSFSVLLRAPFVALAPRANVDAQYLLGLVPCALAAVWLVLALRREVLRRWPGSHAASLLAWVALGSAPVLEAVLYGHPEEVLGAVLCVGAALCALRRQPIATGVLLGLAVATKQWGAFAVLPVLAAGTGSRGRTATAALLVAGALTLPLALGNPGQFGAVSRQAAGIRADLTPLNVWAAISSGALPGAPAQGGFGVRLRAPSFARSLSRPLMAVVILAVSLIAWRRLRRPEDLLGLLALAFLARTVFDPVDNVYYHVPFLLSLAAWEALRREGLPWLTLVSAGVLGAIALAGRLEPTQVGPVVLAYGLWATTAAALIGGAILRARSGSPARSHGRPAARPAT